MALRLRLTGTVRWAYPAYYRFCRLLPLRLQLATARHASAVASGARTFERTLRASGTISIGRLSAAGIVFDAASERLRQHVIKSLLAQVSKLLDADGHAEVTCLGLGAIGPEYPIPPR